MGGAPPQWLLRCSYKVLPTLPTRTLLAFTQARVGGKGIDQAGRWFTLASPHDNHTASLAKVFRFKGHLQQGLSM